MSKRFYDTNGLLNQLNKAFEENFACSSKTLEEIEHIKVSDRKDQDIKFKARKLARLLDRHKDTYEVVIVDENIINIVNDFKLELTPDNLIMASAYYYNKNVEPIIFICDDIVCKVLGRNVFGLKVESIKNEVKNEYKGFKEVILDETEMAYFYAHLTQNTYDLFINEYIVIKNSSGEIVDSYRWDGEAYLPLHKKPVKSIAFGDKIKPKDVYQNMVIDSIIHNTITAISGKAGSGKSLLALVAAMHLIESGKYDRLVVMFNPTKTRGSSDMGFYSGSFIDKAMQNSIGQILTTKFGDRYAVDMMLQQEKIKLVSMADARGMEIKDTEILYITECQNTSVDLLKLCLSRASANCKVIIEGDYTSQVDSYVFDGDKNGMRRAIDVLKGEDIFGFVELQQIWRSKIAELVERM